jgi:hypothetical protein
VPSRIESPLMRVGPRMMPTFPRSPYHAIRFARGTVFGAPLVRNCYGLSGCWPPGTDLTGLPANGGFYFQAFSGSVALSAAGYDYNSVWTPLLAGLSPAGMAASLAALVRPCSCPASASRNASTPIWISHGCDEQSPNSRFALIAAIAGARLLDSWPSACARRRLQSPGEVAPAKSFRI